MANIPRGLDVVSQAFNSDVGVDNEPIQFAGGYVWYDVLGITPSRERPLDEVRQGRGEMARRPDFEQAARESDRDGAEGRARQHACRGSGFGRIEGRDRDGLPPRRLAFRRPLGRHHGRVRTAKDGVGQTPGAGGSEWIVFRVTDVTVPQVDAASEELKKLKDTLQRGLTDEQVAQYVTKIRSEIGTTINQAAFAQVTGANSMIGQDQSKA